MGIPSLYLSKPHWPTQPGQPSVGKQSTGDGYGRHWGRNGEFCIAVGPATTRSAGILTQLVKRAGC